MGGDELGRQGVNFRALRTPLPERTGEKRHGDVLKALTVTLIDTYSKCSSTFGYTTNLAPRRVLTKLSKGVHNGGYDNAEHDYICKVSDRIMNPDGVSYEIMERLGHGTFGQVLKCLPSGGGDLGGHSTVALKIIKNKPAYFHQALVEVRILQMLNSELDPQDENRIVRMLDFFVYRKHLCIVFELLSVNLYDVLKQNSFRGVSMALIRVLTEQLLKAMRCLREACVIHCDLKPENVLLSSMQHTRIKLIDFGSACFENHTVYSYIQSRFYRSPEVLLGLPYTSAIDMWSLGCICAELFLGLPIFPGHSEFDQVCRIVEVLGNPPQLMLDAGKNTRRYFRRVEEIEVPPDSGDATQGAASGSDSHTQHGRPAGQEATRTSGETTSEEEACGAEGAGEHQAEEQMANAEECQQQEGQHSEQPGQEVAGSSGEGTDEPPAKENLRRNESFLDLFKRHLGLSEEEPAGGAEKSEGQGDSNSLTADCMQAQEGVHELGSSGAQDGSSAQEACRSVGSNFSTLAETPETSGGVPRRRDPPSSDDTCFRDGSSDGRGGTLPCASGSSDGGAIGGSSEHSQQPQQRRVRGPRRRRFWRLKTVEEYERDEHKKEPVKKKYFNFKSLEEMVQLVPVRPNLSRRALREEQERRMCFLQFLWGVLQPNPNTRWTPLQASQHNFITGNPLDPDWTPEPDPNPVLSFAEASLPGRVAGGEVPRLPAEGPFGAGASTSGFVGGGSARTYQENVAKQYGGTATSDGESRGPASAPATSRAGAGPTPRGTALRSMGPAVVSAAAAAAAAAPPSTSAASSSCKPGEGDAGKVEATAAASSAASGLWGHLCLGIPLPDDNPNESYRPPVDRMSEEFLRSVLHSQTRRSEQGGGVPSNSPQQPWSGAWSASTGASFCSSASSTGSTPTGGRGRRGTGSSPYQVGSPFGASTRGQAHPQDSKQTGRAAASSHHLSGTTTTPASSPHGSAASANAQLAGAAGGVASQTPHRHQPPAVVHHRRADGSRDGSRGSSPWHLPSPMSELSTASDRMNSSQPSGSDSCGENPLPQYEGAQCNFDGWEVLGGEDHSQSDGVSQLRSAQSDSDCTTPRSNDAPTSAQDERGTGKDSQQPRWENIPQLSRMQLSRGRLHRGDADVTQSPGSMGAMGNFREKVGMNEGGPVTPFGTGARREARIADLATRAEETSASSGRLATERPRDKEGAQNQASSSADSGGGASSGGLSSFAAPARGPSAGGPSAGVVGMLGGPQRGSLRRSL